MASLHMAAFRTANLGPTPSNARSSLGSPCSTSLLSLAQPLGCAGRASTTPKTLAPHLPRRRTSPLSIRNIAQKPVDLIPAVEEDSVLLTSNPSPVLLDPTPSFVVAEKVPGPEFVEAPTSSSTDSSAAAADGSSERAAHQIWLSDVVATQKRPYFLNREWTVKDLQYVGYMAFVHGLCLFAPATFSWGAFGTFVGLYVVTGMLGITLSFHRHLSHRSFVLPKWLEYVFAYCGVQAIQGPPLEWVSAHRFHHRHCDTPEDPHTPYEGFWHSHMGWLLDDTATNERVGVRSNIADLEKDPFYNWIEDTYVWHVVGSAALIYALGGFPALVWGFAVRAVWVYHITWAVNSAAHVWGYQSWNTGDLSRNNWWVGILAFGEGWHNNHHAFEYSCRHGLEWWQYDPTWYTVKLLESVGLAKKLRYPSAEHKSRLAFPGEGQPN